LMDIHRLIDVVKGGSLNILSRYGQYTYRPGSESVSNGINFIEGTLITWELPLDKTVIELSNFGGNDDDECSAES